MRGERTHPAHAVATPRFRRPAWIGSLCLSMTLWAPSVWFSSRPCTMNATFCISSPLTSLQGPSRHQGSTGSLRMRLDCAPSFGAARIGWAPDRSRGGCLSEHPDAPPWGGDALVLEVNVCWDIRVHTSRRLYSAYARCGARRLPFCPRASAWSKPFNHLGHPRARGDQGHRRLSGWRRRRSWPGRAGNINSTWL